MGCGITGMPSSHLMEKQKSCGDSAVPTCTFGGAWRKAVVVLGYGVGTGHGERKRIGW